MKDSGFTTKKQVKINRVFSFSQGNSLMSSSQNVNTATLRKQAIRGTIWTISGYGLSQILRLGSNLFLTHLLAPEIFGFMALVSTFIAGLHLFSDIGVGPNIIQSERGDDPRFLNTAWTLQVIRSIGIWLCCLLLTWPVSCFYQEPKLLWLIPIIGFCTVMSGFSSTAVYTLNRHMAIGRLAVFDLTKQVISIAGMIIWASLNPTIWALVFGNILGSLADLIWSYRLIPNSSNHFTWDREAAKSLFSFGRWIFLSTAVTFLGSQADRLILGKLVSFSDLGVYGIALVLASLPAQVISMISSRVILPIFSKLSYFPRATIREKVLKHRRIILFAGSLGLTILVGLGDFLILFLYDERYSQAAWMLPILALGLWPNLLHETTRQALVSIGKTQYEAIGQLLKCLYVCIGIPIGFSLGGILGVVLVIALNDLPLYGVTSYGLWREDLSTFRQDAITTLFLILMLGLLLSSRYALGYGTPISNLLLTN
jgi:O-antigen/teichoic acid export membrane protein